MKTLPRLAVPLIALLGSPTLAVITSDWSSLPGPRTQYDFVIIGGGTAGSVLANRLSSTPSSFTVLLIESGPSYEGIQNMSIPGYASTMSASPGRYDWNYTVVPQVGLNGRTKVVPRGHVLGGSTAVNGMVYTRGSKDDYDRWADVTGNSGWSWNSLLPYFLKAEKWSPPADGHNTTGHYDPAFHSTQGMVGVSLYGSPQIADERVLQAAAELGGDFEFDLDGNDGVPRGMAWLQLTVAGGERQSAATTYLNATYASRPNLHILVDHLATKISPTVLSNASNHDDVSPSFRTVSFTPRGDGSDAFEVTAKKEVILSAGTYGTPTLLMRSGIGDRAELESLGIETIVDLPSVGKNLTDHPNFSILWNVSRPDIVDPSTNATLQSQFLDQWQTNRTGPLTNLVVNTLGWIRLPDDSPLFEIDAEGQKKNKNFQGEPGGGSNPAPGPTAPHLQISFRNAGLYPNPGPTFSAFCALGTPRSRGTVTINSTDPYAKPLIDYRLLTDPLDIAILRECARNARSFFSAQAFSDYNLSLADVFQNVDLDDDNAVDAVLRNIARDTSHPVSTAMMSPRGAPWGVVDPDLRVKGVKGLRVVDASVMPYITVGNTQAPVYAIAERAADVIKASW